MHDVASQSNRVRGIRWTGQMPQLLDAADAETIGAYNHECVASFDQRSRSSFCRQQKVYLDSIPLRFNIYLYAATLIN